MKKLTSFKYLTLAIASFALLTFSSISTANRAVVGYTHYVTDDIKVPLRSQPTYKHRITRMVDTGAAVKVLEINPEGWARLEYIASNGRKHIGWMPSILLQSQPVARYLLKDELEKSTSLELQRTQLTEEIATLNERLNTTQDELSSISKEAFELNKNYTLLKEVSGNAVNIGLQNDAMNQQVSELQSQNRLYKKQLDQAEDVVERQWFLTGGGVLLLGIIVGLLLRKPRRKKGWNSL